MDIYSKFVLLSVILGLLSAQQMQRTENSQLNHRVLNVKTERAKLQGDLTEFMYFYVDVYVGSFNAEPSKQSLIIDTGSTITLFPCEDYCKDCGNHANFYFPVDKSSTKEIVEYNSVKCAAPINDQDEDKCYFRQSYKEGSSYEGFYVNDYIEFSPIEKHNADVPHQVTFGCVSKETGLFKSQYADGVMGLARGNSNKHYPTINKQFQMTGITDSSMFMLCLGHEGGHIMFGDYDTSLRYSEGDTIQWFPLISEQSYTIELDKLYIGNVHIPHLPRVGLIDSGSSWVIMSHEEDEHIQQAFQQYCSTQTENGERCIGKRVYNEPKCYIYDTTMNTSLRTWFASFPTITFTTASGGQLHWYPSEYFEQRTGTSTFCIQLLSHPNINEIVLGASFLRQNMVVFDPDQKRVAFMRAKCQINNNRVTTLTFDSTLDMAIEECHDCDVIQEEINIILFVAVGLLVIMLLAVVVLVGSYVLRHVKFRSSKVEYTQYFEEETHRPNGSTEMDRVGFMSRVDEDDF